MLLLLQGSRNELCNERPSISVEKETGAYEVS